MIVCGIDLSYQTFDVCILDGKKKQFDVFENNESGFENFLLFLHTNSVDVIGLESTGNYGKKLIAYLRGNGQKVYILHPVKVRNFAKTQKVQGKTDKLDAYVIARFVLISDDLNEVSYAVRDALKPYLSSLKQLEKQRQQLKNLKHSIELYPEDFTAQDYLVSALSSINYSCKKIEHEAYKKMLELVPESEAVIDEIKGLGEALLIYIVAYVYDNMESYSLKQHVSFIGLNPVPYQSGTTVYKKDHIGKRGNAVLLKKLYMATISAIRNNSIISEKYKRLKDNGKPSKVAIVACMSHLFRAILSRLSYHTGRVIPS